MNTSTPPRLQSEGSGEGLEAWSLPLITTKLSPPRLAGRLVERQQLLQTLSSEARKALILVEASAGFGKTTLLAQWRKELLSQGRAVAWLSLDGEDNTPHQFMTYLVSALGAALPGVGEGARALLQSGPLVPPKVVISILINELASLQQEVYLILDDYHVITNADINQVVDYFLTHTPENFHLVIASRSEPELALAGLRARGQLFELSDRDLRFKMDECRQYFDSAVTEKLSSSDIQRLHDATEGWVTGLQIAAISPGIKHQAAGLKETISGGMKAISAYMGDVVLTSLSKEVLQFLLRTSLLERFNVSLCDAVTGTENSQAIVDFLISHRLFIQPLDEEGTWFRFHHLFADYLKHRLLQEYAQETVELHRRAYNWFAGQQLWAEAVRHALASGDSEKAVAWVEQCAMSMVEASNMAQLMEWVGHLPEEPLKKRLPLMVAEAWSLALLFKFEETKRVLEQIEAELDLAPEEERLNIAFSVKVIRALIFGLSDDTLAARSLGTELLEQWPRDADLPFAVGVLCNVLTFAHLHAGEYEKAKDVQLRALDDDSGRTNLFVTVYRKDLIGLIALKQGRLSEALKWFEDSLLLAEKKEGRRSVVATMSACFLAKVFYEQNRIDEAEVLLADRWDIVDEGCFVDAAMRGYLTASRIQLHQGDAERARELLQQAERVATRRGWTRMLAACSAERIRIALSEGDVRAAEEQLQRLQSLVPEDRSPVASASSSITYLAAMAQARVAIAKAMNGDNHSARDTVDVLRSMIEELSALGSQYASNEVRIVLCLALESIGEREQALDCLAWSLKSGKTMGFLRSFLDEGQPLFELLQAYSANHDSNEYLESLRYSFTTELESAEVDTAVESGKANEESTDISHRELEILTLIEKGLANKEIARILGISLGTVKWHVKNIFRKLDVSSRTQAVSEAKAMGLMQS